MEFTALLNNMRVYLILDWLQDVSKYLLENPDQERCDHLRAKTAQLMARFGQVNSGEHRKLDSVSRKCSCKLFRAGIVEVQQ